jgi:tetrahydromethanopterin S-methyltransferase subunit C
MVLTFLLIEGCCRCVCENGTSPDRDPQNSVDTVILTWIIASLATLAICIVIIVGTCIWSLVRRRGYSGLQ